MKIRKIGIVLETYDDALATGVQNTDHLYHWREPDEIAQIIKAVENSGYTPVILGTPGKICGNIEMLRSQVDLILNLSVGFLSRFRLSLPPSLFELAGIPYTGADPYTRMVSQNKHIQKSFFDSQGLPTPAWSYIHHPEEIYEKKYPPFPLIVKPAFEGSSIGITEKSLVRNFAELKERAESIFSELRMPVIVECFIEGRELKVGFLGNQPLRFKGGIEDVVGNGEPMGWRYLYFNVKKTGTFSKKKVDISDPSYQGLMADCEKIYRMFLPMDYGTFDIRINNQGKHYFLEFNADATLHPDRTLAQCCALNGISFNEMIKIILHSAMERRNLL